MSDYLLKIITGKCVEGEKCLSLSDSTDKNDDEEALHVKSSPFCKLEQYHSNSNYEQMCVSDYDADNNF